MYPVPFLTGYLPVFYNLPDSTPACPGPGQTGAEGNDSFVIRFQNLIVYTGLIVKAFHKALGYDLHQVFITLIIFCQKNQMVIPVLSSRIFPVKPGETGSMTAAAQILYIAQPAISLAVSEMEEHYKVRLFDRISRRLYLTDSGRQALEYARHIIALFDEMEQGVGGGQAAKELWIGTSITIGSCLLPGYIRELKERFPSLTVQAAVGNSEAIEQKLLENQIDIGIIEGMVHSPYIHCRTFPGDRLVFICPPAHPFAGHTLKSAEELAGQDLILRERGSAGREVLDGILAAGEISVKPLWESVSNEAVLEGVKAGLGLSLLPYYLVRDSLEKGQVKEFFIRGLALSRKFSVIYHKNKFLTKEARTLIGLAAGEEEG